MDETNEKKFNVDIKIILIVILALSAIVGFYGYNYYKKTPEYSLKIIVEAIKNNNLEEFNRHVDLHSIIDDYYDTCMYYEIENNKSINAYEKEMTLNYVREMKPSAVNEFENELKSTMIKGDNSPKNKNINNKISGFKYDGVKSKEYFDKYCIVTLDITDNETNKKIFPKLRMMQLEDRTWKIVKIDNIIDFYRIFKGEI